jgi:hypothetical protein
MAISDPIGRANAVRTPLQAARLMARLEHEISEDPSASEEWHEQADRAIDSLRERFPTARTLDAYMQPPASSPAARATLWADPRPGTPSPASRPAHDDAPGRRQPPRSSGSDRPARKPRPASTSPRRRRTVRHAIEAAGVLAALASIAALVLRHLRRHPKHFMVAGVVVLGVATGRPTVIGTAAVIMALVTLARRGQVPRPPAPPRPPRAPVALRAPRAPRSPR